MALALKMDTIKSFKKEEAFICKYCKFVGQVREWYTDDNEHIINWGRVWHDYAPKFCPQCGKPIQ